MSVELKQLAISAAEWEIMRVVWAEGAVTSRQVIDTMLGLSDWKEGTIKSMLNRLTKKGVLTQDTTVTPFLYSSSISLEDATLARTDEIMVNTCNLDRADIVQHLLDSNTFSQAQILGLLETLQDKLKTAPEKIKCDCAPGQCQCHSQGHGQYA
ncbi:BlaI/MecI/CopY family transcriptional regulator [Fundicoccus sp. Sow4_D5]